MKYRYKRHISNTLLYAVIITALIALIKEYSVLWTVVFGILGIILLVIDGIIENNHLRGEEEREKKRHYLQFSKLFPDVFENRSCILKIPENKGQL